MTSLSIIGAGNLGKSLGRLWARQQAVQVRQVLNRSLASASAAIEFIGQGEAVGGYAELAPCDLLLLSVGDDALCECAKELAQANVLHSGTVVFHCSGSQPSTLLEPVARQGALLASVHPLKSFADPATAAETFAGTPCGIEGEPEACQKLGRLFSRCGGQVFALRPESKLLYHAATVLVCNDLTALIEAGLRCMAGAGIARPEALRLLLPIIEETIRNNARLGTVGALTGPIARGDAQLVSRQSTAVAELDPVVSRVYDALGVLAVALSRSKGNASAEALARISDRLEGKALDH